MRINWKDVFKFLSGAFFVTAGGQLVSFVVSHQCSRSFPRTYDDPGVSENPRLYTFRVVSDLLLPWIHKEVRKRKKTRQAESLPADPEDLTTILLVAICLQIRDQRLAAGARGIRTAGVTRSIC